MGRQWLQKNKAITANKKAKITTKLVREITIAAKMGAADPDMNPRLAMAVEAARKQSVSNDTIKRAIQKGSGEGGYLGAPAAIASAVNDALSPLGLTIHELPMRMHKLEALINEAKT